MLPFVPRSVAGTKRSHPRGVPPPAPHVEWRASSPGDVRPMAARLLNELSPWWMDRVDTPLAHALRARRGEPMHLAQIATDAHMQMMGCASLADLCAALHWLYPLGWLQPGPDTMQAIWARAGPYTVLFLEHVSSHACDALEVAMVVQALAQAVDASLDPVVYAVLPPYADEAPRKPATVKNRDALVVVDPATAEALLAHFSWDRTGPAWPAARWAKLGADETVRCISQARYDALRREYVAWHKELVAQNTGASKAAVAQAREADQVRAAAYPSHTIVCLVRGSDETAPQIKARLASLGTRAVDYVDVSSSKPTAYVRCTTAEAALALAEALGTGAYVLRGAEQDEYWRAVPLRVQNAARRRSEQSQRT
ncbi:hypothetical protein MCAP1_002770 [Malassezia caprae]|uniref:Uncharacterized protein n=1 Tax=Malassezia caprae TaxID=1381934 RepID=A0AAF0E945_9BASI|nr:hypothetical protein MCAP1_002770 [Malassezia caprae]